MVNKNYLIRWLTPFQLSNIASFNRSILQHSRKITLTHFSQKKRKEDKKKTKKELSPQLLTPKGEKSSSKNKNKKNKKNYYAQGEQFAREKHSIPYISKHLPRIQTTHIRGTRMNRIQILQVEGRNSHVGSPVKNLNSSK